MSVFVGNFVEVSDQKSWVLYVNNNLDEVPQSLLESGEIVDSLPVANLPDGFSVTGLFINPVTKELWYEYTDIPVTQEDQQQQETQLLKYQLNEVMVAIAELASANEQDKIETQLAIAELASIVTGGVE